MCIYLPTYLTIHPPIYSYKPKSPNFVLIHTVSHCYTTNRYDRCLVPKQPVITKHSFPSVLQSKISLTECYLQAVTSPIPSADFE